MEIIKIEAFISYYEKTRETTLKVIEVIPHDKLDWSYMTGKFTIGDVVRHIAAIERNIFAEVALGNKPNYKGCRKDLADGYENIVRYFNEMHRQSIAIFKSLKDESLKSKIKSLNGNEIELGHFLRALLLHEIHHRAALVVYLNILGVATPPMIGLMEEQVIELSK
ncbi:hypothetical protein BH11BAC2_BH11BAC2_09630 [soil metagenome]